MAIQALITDETGKAIKDALASIQQAIQQQGQGGQGGGVSISVETDPEALTTLSQSVVYFLAPGTWTAFSPAVTVPEGKFGIAKYGTAWTVTVLGGGELASAIAAMTAADELTGDEVLPMGSGESVTVQQLAEFAEGVVGGNAAHVSGETADQAKLASVGKVQELIGDGRRVVPVTSDPATLDQSVIYLVHGSSSDVTIGTETVNAGTNAHVYYNGTNWVVVEDGDTPTSEAIMAALGSNLDKTSDTTDLNNNKIPTTAKVNEMIPQYEESIPLLYLYRDPDDSSAIDPTLYQLEKMLSATTGSVIDATSHPTRHVVSDFIEIPANTKAINYSGESFASANFEGVWFYDGDKNFISKHTTTSGNTKLHITLPNNAAYIRWAGYCYYGFPSVHDIRFSIDAVVSAHTPQRQIIAWKKEVVFDEIAMNTSRLTQYRRLKSDGSINELSETTSANSLYYITELLDIRGKRIITSQKRGSSTYVTSVFYDENEKIVSYNEGELLTDSIAEIPSNASYMRRMYWGLSKDYLYLYTPIYEDEFTVDSEFEKMRIENSLSLNHWHNKRAVAFGASGMQGLHAGKYKDYPTLASMRLGMDMNNYAKTQGLRYYYTNYSDPERAADCGLSTTRSEAEAVGGNVAATKANCWDNGIFAEHTNYGADDDSVVATDPIDLCVFGDGDSSHYAGMSRFIFVHETETDEGNEYFVATGLNEEDAKSKLGSSHAGDTLYGDLVSLLSLPSAGSTSSVGVFSYNTPGTLYEYVNGQKTVYTDYTLEGQRDTYVGAIIYLLQKLWQYHPQARVVFTNDYLYLNANGTIKYSKKDRVRELAAKLNIRFIDFTDRLQITALNWERWYRYAEPIEGGDAGIDRVHPNREGVERIANMFVHELLLIS